MSDVLSLHIDTPDKRHRLLALDGQRLRCIDCCHTIVLPVAVSAPASTSTSLPLKSNDPNRCALHVGQRKDFCGPCRSELLEASAVSA